MKNTVRKARSVVWFPFNALQWLGLPVAVLKPVLIVTVTVDKPFRKYLLGGQL